MTLANLGSRAYPRATLAPTTRADPALTDMQRRTLEALTKCLNQNGSADTLAHLLGYRPATTGRLAVSSALRALLRPGTDVGPYVVRLAGRDQWSPATWCLQHQHVQYVDADGQPCRLVLTPGRMSEWHLLENPALS